MDPVTGTSAGASGKSDGISMVHADNGAAKQPPDIHVVNRLIHKVIVGAETIFNTPKPPYIALPHAYYVT